MKLLIIGAGWEQEPHVRAARLAGHWIVATHPSADGPGLRYAHESAVVDPRDLPALAELAAHHGVEAVLADQCDYSVFATAWLGEHLGLPSIGLPAAQASTHKRAQREAVDAAGLSHLQPRWRAVRTLAGAREAATAIGYPVIVKPTDNRGNFGVTRVREPGALDAAVLEALAHAHSREVLVEEYIEGLLTTVEGLALGPDRCVDLAASWKEMLGGDKRVAMRLVYDTARLAPHLDALRDANQRVVRALGIRRGLTHGEFFVRPSGEVVLVECHNRGGGAHIATRIVPAVAGLDTSAALIAQACGQEPDLTGVGFAAHGSAVMSFFELPPGRLLGWSGEDAIHARNDVLDFRMLVRPGEVIRPIVGDATRHAMLITRGPDEAACRASHDACRELLQLEY